MTIDEAIKHCEEKAEDQEYVSQIIVELHHEESEREHKAACDACAAEQRQLAAWLRDLRQAKAIILDMSYTLEALCDKVNAEIGCSKCPYSDGGCRVKSWLARQRAFCIGGEGNDS